MKRQKISQSFGWKPRDTSGLALEVKFLFQQENWDAQFNQVQTSTDAKPLWNTGVSTDHRVVKPLLLILNLPIFSSKLANPWRTSWLAERSIFNTRKRSACRSSWHNSVWKKNQPSPQYNSMCHSIQLCQKTGVVCTILCIALTRGGGILGHAKASTKGHHDEALATWLTLTGKNVWILYMYMIISKSSMLYIYRIRTSSCLQLYIIDHNVGPAVT